MASAKGEKEKEKEKERNKSGDSSVLEEYTDFYQKLEGVSKMRCAKSGDIRSSSAGEIEVQGLKKSSSCAGLLMTTSPKATEVGENTSKAPLPVLTSVPLMSLPGRPRHFSAPSGQGTPRSKTSTIDHTPSWGASRASLTEAGNIYYLYKIRMCFTLLHLGKSTWHKTYHKQTALCLSFG